jgi:hypothetical protein
MSHDKSKALPPLAGMARAGPHLPNEWAGGGVLVWRLRFWMLAAAVVAAAADSNGAAAQRLATRDAAEPAGCAMPHAERTRKFSWSAMPLMPLQAIRVGCTRVAGHS